MRTQTIENDCEDVIYNHTDYNKKLFVNGIVISIMITLTCIVVFSFLLPAVFNTIIKPMVNNLYNESLTVAVSPYKDFFIKHATDGTFDDDTLSEVRDLILLKYGGDLSKFYNSLETLFNMVSFLSMLVIGTLISFYVRSNADVFIIGLGTLQKKMLIAGLKENLRIDAKNASAHHAAEMAKNELRESKRKWRHDHEKEKAKLKLDKIRDKASRRVS